MKNKKIIVLLIVINIILVVTICGLINKNINEIRKETITIKEMSETEYDNSINALNKSHTDYANYVQECKVKLATTLTNEGVETSNEDTLETITENIPKILRARTADATATADNITEGKTAYVNGELITGTGADNNSYYSSAINDILAKIGDYRIASYSFSNVDYPSGDKTYSFFSSFPMSIDINVSNAGLQDCKIYIDNSLVISTNWYSFPSSGIVHFCTLNPGSHTIRVYYKGGTQSGFTAYINVIGIDVGVS